MRHGAVSLSALALAAGQEADLSPVGVHVVASAVLGVMLAALVGGRPLGASAAAVQPPPCSTALQLMTADDRPEP